MVKGSSQDDEFRHTGLDPPINVTSYNNDMKGSSEHRLENVRSRKIDEVMLVDWLDDSFPRGIPGDFGLEKDGDTSLVRKCFKKKSNCFEFFHQLGVLETWFKNADQSTDEYEVY